MRIGLYAGTFDPVHEGHVGFARDAMETARLDKVIFYPERSPKSKPEATSFEIRLSRLVYTVEEYKSFSVVPPLHEVTTLNSTMRQFPVYYEKHTVVLMIGSDIIPMLKYWQNTSDILREHEFCVGLRDDATAETARKQMDLLGTHFGIRVRYTVATTDYADVSSSRVRLATQS